MALDNRIRAMVEKAKIKGNELNIALAARRERRNDAIRSYQSDEFDDIETGDVAREEMDFIQRVEADNGDDVGRFAAILGVYLAGAPVGDRKRILDNLMCLSEAVAHIDLQREVLEGLDSLT